MLPLATSVDGRAFEFQASLHGLALRRGAYVVLEHDGGRRFGQITDLSSRRPTRRSRAPTGRCPASGSGRRSAPDSSSTRASPSTTRWCGRPSRPRSASGSTGPDGATGPAWSSGSCCSHPVSLPSSTAEGSTGTRSCAGSRARGRRTRSGCCSSACLPRPRCASSSSIPTPTTSGSVGSVTAPTRSAAEALSDGARRRRRVEQRTRRGPAAAAALRRARSAHPGRRSWGWTRSSDRDEYAVLTDLLRNAEPGRRVDHRPRPADRLDEPERAHARHAGAQPRRARLGGLEPDGAVPPPGAEGRRPAAASSWTSGHWRPSRSSAWSRTRCWRSLWSLRREREPVLVVIDEAHNICAAEPSNAVELDLHRAGHPDRGGRAGSTGSTCWSPPSARTRSTRTWSPSATTCC